MSWISGADIADDIWKMIVKRLPQGQRQTVARDFVEYFENRGCDSMMGTAVGEVAGTIPPEDEDSSTCWAWKF